MEGAVKFLVVEADEALDPGLRADLLDTWLAATDAGGVTGMMQWILPFGAFSGPNWMSLYARRHMHEYGTTREQLAQISLNARRNAATAPSPSPLSRKQVPRLLWASAKPGHSFSACR